MPRMLSGSAISLPSLNMESDVQAPAGLAPFPTEILYLVLKLLSPAEYYLQSLVSKIFHALIEPFLCS
ncbi:hypothetical protein BJX66DRAFT_171752 [Aspergillus keveii]|uniref:F-box domain-containing protein n=1 Tax=Aspergillus keveii TaxID=714993 RepID=A0ABR4G8H6_9EURO